MSHVILIPPPPCDYVNNMGSHVEYGFEGGLTAREYKLKHKLFLKKNKQIRDLVIRSHMKK